MRHQTPASSSSKQLSSTNSGTASSKTPNREPSTLNSTMIASNNSSHSNNNNNATSPTSSPTVSAPTPPATSAGKRTPPKSTSANNNLNSTITPNRASSQQNLTAVNPALGVSGREFSPNSTSTASGTFHHVNSMNFGNNTPSLGTTVNGMEDLGNTVNNQQGGSILTSNSSSKQLPRRQAHFVLETIRLKNAAVISGEISEQHIVAHDNVHDGLSMNKEMILNLFEEDRHSSEELDLFLDQTALLQSATSNTTTTNVDVANNNNNNNKKKNPAGGALASAGPTAVDPCSSNFNEVRFASEILGAGVELQAEIDKFFETGVPLVSTDQVPDADALIVVSAGPDGNSAAKLTLNAVEAATKYMALRSLCVHISACALFGDVNEMLGKASNGLNLSSMENNHGDGNSEKEFSAAKVFMCDLLEQGRNRVHKPFALSEPADPFFDRYTPKQLLRLGLSAEDASDKFAQMRILAEDQMVKQFPKAVGFMFFVDCIHFRDGFQRFTSDSHVTIQSQHPASSLFFSRTTLLATHVPAIASAFVGHLAGLPPTALQQPWVTHMRHLGSETHHVLNLVASIPDEGSIGGIPRDAQDVETVTDVDDLSFDLSHKENPPAIDTAEQVQNKKRCIMQLKKGFEVATALKAAAQAGARTPIPDHIFPRRTHLKLSEYVAVLRRQYDEGTNEQKTRHSYAKPALQYLSTQVKGDAEVQTAMSGLHDNRHRFAAIFRAAFVKSKVQKEAEKRTGSNSRSHSLQQSQNVQRNLMGPNFPNNNNNNNNNNNSISVAGGNGNSNNNNNNFNNSINNASMMSPGNFGNTLNFANLNIAALLSGAANAGASVNSFADLNTKDAAKIRQQNEALFLIKERLEFDLAKLDKETKKLRGELSTSQTKRKRLERELTDSQGGQLIAEASVQKLQTEQDTECLELRQRLLNMQQQVDALGRRNEQLTNDIRTHQAEFDRRERSMKQDTELQFRDLQADLEVALAEKEVLKESLEEHTGRIHALEELLVQVEVEKKTLNQQLQESKTAIEAAKAEALKAIDRASRMRKAEREEYMKQLESGKAATEELVTFEDLRVDRVSAMEGLYRSGGDAAVKWLKAIGLEQYGPAFRREGFTDVLSVANITEGDLLAMKILAGHRRKILSALTELKTHLGVAMSKRKVAPMSHELVDFEKLVERQREWYRDFATVVRAEQANDDDEVFM